jgi:hypothetical protein
MSAREPANSGVAALVPPKGDHPGGVQPPLAAVQ